jgi:hypothetical protein
LEITFRLVLSANWHAPGCHSDAVGAIITDGSGIGGGSGIATGKTEELLNFAGDTGFPGAAYSGEFVEDIIWLIRLRDRTRTDLAGCQ